MKEIRNAVTSWEQKHLDRFKKERKTEEEFVDDSGIPVRRVYTPLDLEEKGFDYMQDLGLPGEYPYVRGITPGGYREKLWSISHPSGYALPEDTNKLWKAGIEAGLDNCHIIYDMPTQYGLDPDNPRAEGEVGRVGVSLVSQRDWEIAFDGIDLGKTRVSQTAIAMGFTGIANYLCMARKQGVDWKGLSASSCLNDILMGYVARGTYIFPPEPSLRLVTDCLGYCAEHAPGYQALQVSGVQYSESQMTPLHEAALTLAAAFCYLQAAVDRGVDVDLIAPGMQFITQTEHYGFFQEVAKHRAMRKIYSRTLKERFGANKPESMMCRMHIVQGGNSMQRQQYLNNIVRSTVAGMGAVFAGAEKVNLRPYDERFGIPTDEAIIMNVRLQHVLAQETGITDTVDPLAGSYFVETLTREFEDRINKEIETIEQMGGVVRCIENGYLKKVLVQDAYKWQKDFDRGKVVRVGVNFYPGGEEDRPFRVYRTDPGVEQQRINAVRELRKKRDNARVRKALEEVKATASLLPLPRNNLLPAVMEAVESYATVAEICDALRAVWGEYRQPSVF